MAKRFTDTDKWKRQWFRHLKPAMKCFWSYVLDNCNNAGIWEVDFEAASFNVGEELNALDVMEAFRKQYFPFALGKRWFIIDFVDFQYGELKPSSNAHVAVINTLKKHDLFLVYQNRSIVNETVHQENQPDSGVPRRDQRQEEEQAKDKEQDLDLESEKKTIASDVPKESIDATRKTLLKAEFDAVRKSYPGTRGGLIVEWANFEKKNHDHLAEVVPLLGPAIAAEKAHKELINQTRTDPLQWKHFSTWINKRCWEQELEAINGKNGSGGRTGNSVAQRNNAKLAEQLGKIAGAARVGPGGGAEVLHLLSPGNTGIGHDGR